MPNQACIELAKGNQRPIQWQERCTGFGIHQRLQNRTPVDKEARLYTNASKFQAFDNTGVFLSGNSHFQNHSPILQLQYAILNF